MTESQVVNEWIRQGEARGKLMASRQKVLDVSTVRFPGSGLEEATRLIHEQDSLPLLDHWFMAGLRADTFEQFTDVLKQ